MNNLLRTDSYKMSHFKMYPPRLEKTYAYIEARKSKGEIVFYGINEFIKNYLINPFFNQGDIESASYVCEKHGVPFNRQGWQYILDKYSGILPVEIHSIPEGSVVPSRTPLVAISNRDKNLPWLPTWLETILLRAIWYPTTIASNGRKIKKLLYHYYEKSGTLEGLDYKLHDFGARGVSSGESARIGGLAHLIHFKGSDTLEAAELNGEILSSSIPAAEHSTIMTHLNEFCAYRHIIDAFPEQTVAIVADTYDIYNAVTNIFGVMLHGKITNKNGGSVVIRPDSGTPHEIVPGIILRLMEKFGSEKNCKGYRVLPPYIRVVQGDGININSIEKICEACMSHGLSMDNIAAFGMGSKLLQEVSRDDYNFAMKVSNIVYDGQSIPVCKRPLGDSSKASKFGKFDNLDFYFYLGNYGKFNNFSSVRARANKDFSGS